MTEDSRTHGFGDSSGDRTLPLTRRGVLAAGAVGVLASGSATARTDGGEEDGDEEDDGDGPPFAPGDHDHSGERGSTARLGDAAPVESITARTITAENVNDVRHVHAGDWDDRLQAEIDAAAAEAEREVVVHGNGVFEPTTTVFLPDDLTLTIDEGVRLVPPSDHELAEIETGNRTYRTLITNADHDDGNEAVAVEGGYVSFENVDWDELSHAPVWFHNCVSPRQEGVTVEDVMYDYGSADGTRQFGVYITESEGGIQRRCVARRVGYDGIANRGYGSTRNPKIIGCEAYDIPGTGIQIAGDVRNQSTPSDAPYLDEYVIRECKTDAYITVHSGGDGASDGLIEDNDARMISLIADGPFDNVTIRNNVVSQLLVAIRDRITNLTIRGQQNRDGRQDGSIRLIGYGTPGVVDRLTIADCFSRDRTFLQNELHELTSVSDVRLLNNVFDPDHDDATFVDGAIEPHFGGDGAESDLQGVDIVANTIHDATVINEGVDTARLRDNTLVGANDSPGLRYDTSDLFVEATAPVDDSFPEAIQFEPDGPDEWWTFEFDIDEAGEYEVELETLFVSSYGTYELSVNGEQVDTIDFYAESFTRDTITYVLELAEGTNTVRFEAVGKNEESSDYNMALYYLNVPDAPVSGPAISSRPVPRLLNNGRGTNEGDPSDEGEWHGYAPFAEQSNALVRDTTTDDWYRAVDGDWMRL
ncbi:hypothetical protein [Halomontanus rarus]|uniref:hypothetical protein n=1 Tax=Halomontanus rarus TaxID=3034020 RepID=UPI0023E8AE81|nr:hypothetical protein [Halovivax sp. TS33]